MVTRSISISFDIHTPSPPSVSFERRLRKNAGVLTRECIRLASAKGEMTRVNLARE